MIKKIEFNYINKIVQKEKSVTNIEIKQFNPESFLNIVDVITNRGYQNVEKNSRLNNLLDVGLEYIKLLENKLLKNTNITEEYRNERLSKINYGKLLINEQANEIRDNIKTNSNYVGHLR